MGFKVAAFTLNQWALDFKGNLKRIATSIDQAYESGAIYRTGPELEICGYSLEDSFFEQDTIDHCWSCLKQVIDHSKHMNMIIDVGMPIYNNSLYNCRVLLYQGRILCIRAKTNLAKEGNYREFRHFTEWPVQVGIVPFKLPPGFGSKYVPFGADFILEVSMGDKRLKIGWEICQELWEMKNVSSQLCNDFGCHLIVNSSASYWELRKLNRIVNLVRGVSERIGACYCYSNLVGCDGQRYVFYGRSFIVDRGNLICIAPTSTSLVQSSTLLEEVSMITHTVHPRDIDEYRAQTGIRPRPLPVKFLDLDSQYDGTQLDSSYKILQLAVSPNSNSSNNSPPNHNVRAVMDITFEQEIYHYVSLWLWDYLRRSNMSGFMMPLSGGLDSSCVATLVYCMCCILHQQLNDETVRKYFEIRHQISPDCLHEVLSSPQAICARLLKCRYISTQYSSKETENRARHLCRAIGADYDCVSIQDLYNKCRDIGKQQSQQETTGNANVSLLEQNIQARLRMMLTYYLSDGNRIVLATGNVDEGIMGYLTKYDCSSADINPIGGLCKSDLKDFLKHCCKDLFAEQEDLVQTLGEIIEAPPSAELTGAEQRDEDEIGLTYDEIAVLGRARRGIFGCSGPRGIFETIWRNRLNEPYKTKIRCLSKLNKQTQGLHEIAEDLASLVKRFYKRYARNRHKLTVLTPALHAETYSPDDHRFDHRQILYPSLDYQFESIDELVKQIKESGDLKD